MGDSYSNANENHFAGMPGVKKKKEKKKDIRISKFYIECQPTERIIKYSGPVLQSTHIQQSKQRCYLS